MPIPQARDPASGPGLCEYPGGAQHQRVAVQHRGDARAVHLQRGVWGRALLRARAARVRDAGHRDNWAVLDWCAKLAGSELKVSITWLYVRKIIKDCEGVWVISRNEELGRRTASRARRAQLRVCRYLAVTCRWDVCKGQK